MAAAAPTGVLTEAQRATLETVFDTFIPAVEVEEGEQGYRDFMARAPSDMGVPAEVEKLMAQAMVPEEIEQFAELLDSLAEHDLAAQPLEARTAIVNATMDSSPEALHGMHALKALAFLFFYGLPDELGRNPNWEPIGYPGPVSAPPSPEEAPKTIPIEEVDGDAATLQADVCVVGSGAGGAVIAAELQQAGRSVLVLEQGPYQNESDFKQLELPGSLELYLGGGLIGSEDGSINVYAGSCLGGGTTVNYMNCLRTPDSIRAEWARYGLEGLDSPEYDRHLDAVMERISASTEATSQNRTHRKLIAAFDELGYEHRPIVRNADSSCDDPRVCGYCLTGCQKGCKQGAMRTYLQDAADAGARFVVGCRAERVLASDGRATGVEATLTHADGSQTSLTVEAPCVVVACGSVESPALLLRSGIGGPAVGKHLRLHPAGLVLGVYEERIEGWIGQIQSEVSDRFARLEGDHGFLFEGVGMLPGLIAAAAPWTDGRKHKEEQARTFAHLAPFVTVARDHGEGEVVIDDYGRAVVRWSLSDEVDRRLFVRANAEMARLHRAAGAKEVMTLHRKPVSWMQGEDFDRFLRSIEEAPYEAHEVAIFTAHQLCSCRMGSDPADSVADGRGQLHDTDGVWIGDASAFPTASGVNPMVSIMALARRTAGAIAAVEAPSV
jgi:choline dehydrogenase-like flavoprotein